MCPVKSVTVFCGSASGTDPAFRAAANDFGSALANAGLQLVYGGGGIGLMGDLARAASAGGGRVIGVMTTALVRHEQSWDGCSEMVVVDSMRQRKEIMDSRGDAFVALPGGLGTYDELLDAITGRVVGSHSKPIGLLEVNGFFQPFLTLVDHGVKNGFIRSSTRELLVIESDPIRLLEGLRTHRGCDDPRALLPMHGADSCEQGASG
ncbi:MAG: TIGR00730 family Rossman fold protein [Phycisphaerales bacterium]|nr:TIGR00730 family Rossman fold protein [Phycisphaerales bacterium]